MGAVSSKEGKHSGDDRGEHEGGALGFISYYKSDPCPPALFSALKCKMAYPDFFFFCHV